jgi:putative endonuclease
VDKTNYQTGHDAEKYAAEYLKSIGYKIIELNWKIKNCEIDIIASKQGVVHFVEVKYRKTNMQGFGLDYVTPKKVSQMQFAAECWVAINSYEGEYELSALEVTGLDYAVTNFLPNIL